jgi:hypothetical protein
MCIGDRCDIDGCEGVIVKRSINRVIWHIANIG